VGFRQTFDGCLTLVVSNHVPLIRQGARSRRLRVPALVLVLVRMRYSLPLTLVCVGFLASSQPLQLVTLEEMLPRNDWLLLVVALCQLHTTAGALCLSRSDQCTLLLPALLPTSGLFGAEPGVGLFRNPNLHRNDAVAIESRNPFWQGRNMVREAAKFLDSILPPIGVLCPLLLLAHTYHPAQPLLPPNQREVLGAQPKKSPFIPSNFSHRCNDSFVAP
jgi:hypothetical protein